MGLGTKLWTGMEQDVQPIWIHGGDVLVRTRGRVCSENLSVTDVPICCTTNVLPMYAPSSRSE